MVVKFCYHTLNKCKFISLFQTLMNAQTIDTVIMCVKTVMDLIHVPVTKVTSCMMGITADHRIVCSIHFIKAKTNCTCISTNINEKDRVVRLVLGNTFYL
jgi:hypothetical protein